MRFIYLQKKYFCVAATLVFALSAVTAAYSQGFDKIDRDRMKSILKNIKNDIRKNYYDPNFTGSISRRGSKKPKTGSTR